MTQPATNSVSIVTGSTVAASSSEPPLTSGRRRIIVTNRTNATNLIVTSNTNGPITDGLVETHGTVTTTGTTWAEVNSMTSIMDTIYLSYLSDNTPIHIWTGTGWDTSTTCSSWIIQNWDYPNAANAIANAGPNFNSLGSQIKRLRGNNRPIRSAIKKGLKLITGLGFNDEIKCFLGGSGVEVYHPESDFKFVLTRDQSIIQRTQYPGYSTPYKLELYTKTNVFVSKLCVIMESTPVLDQVLAMIMFIKSGDEEMILRKANYPGLTSDMELRKQIALKHPHLLEKMRVDESGSVNRGVTGNTQGWYINAASACG